MSLKDMAMTRGDRKRNALEAKGLDEARFPWGLALTLDNAALQKLGLAGSDFKAGECVYLACKARCKSVTVSDEGKAKDATVRLQIESMDVSTNEDKANKAFDRTFGDEK